MYCRKPRSPDAERVDLPIRVNELFTQSRSAAGRRSIMLMIKEYGMHIGRFKVCKLMRGMSLISKQPGSHAQKKANEKRPDIPDVLDWEFVVVSPNEVWCGDITYVWAEGRWHYPAAGIDLCARQVIDWAFSSKPDADLVIKALDMAYE